VNHIFLLSEEFTVFVMAEEGGPVKNICPASLSMLLWKGIASGSRPHPAVSHSVYLYFDTLLNYNGGFQQKVLFNDNIFIH